MTSRKSSQVSLLKTELFPGRHVSAWCRSLSPMTGGGFPRQSVNSWPCTKAVTSRFTSGQPMQLYAFHYMLCFICLHPSLVRFSGLVDVSSLTFFTCNRHNLSHCTSPSAYGATPPAFATAPERGRPAAARRDEGDDSGGGSGATSGAAAARAVAESFCPLDVIK